MSPAWLTPSPIPPLAMSPVDNFWRSPLTTVVVPERKLFELAEKPRPIPPTRPAKRSEEHTSELQSLMRSSYAVFCLNKKTIQITILQGHMRRRRKPPETQ